MEFRNNKPTCAELKKIDMVDFLASLGFYPDPQKSRGTNHWYHSPLNPPDNSPSFKVNSALNTWYDHSIGAGGTLIDFATRFFNCSVSELLSNWGNDFSFHPQQHIPVTSGLPAEQSAIKVFETLPLQHPALLQYISSRQVSIELAKRYCQEVHFELLGRHNFAVGFANSAGGFELRNKYFKGSSAPKAVTVLNAENGDTLKVFEGFFDFLSYQHLMQLSKLPPQDFLILNSLSFFEQSRPFMETYKHVELYLDSNTPARRITEQFIKENPCYADQSYFYRKFDDLNDFLCNSSRINKRIPALPEYIPRNSKKRGIS
ncbi:toprim domain-containing protein [Chitinophaga barathri]|uniref:DNA primase n=1 Tax=Chitinophaga barathri TaxID=1647451 RepID=A0A3N4MGU1_9BACT|nr:toprim domain-containing protein [Chitinophaga barathri]RPD39310.1 DNA primase [Chitinophaga barathri]